MHSVFRILSVTCRFTTIFFISLVIGRGGEQITRLQAESGCKIQMAPDSGGMPDRICTLTGNTQSIA